MSLGRSTGKKVLHHYALKWSQIPPLLRSFQLDEDVVPLSEDKHLRNLLFANLDISAHRQIHENRGDIARVRAVVDQGTHFCRAHVLRWFIHGSYRHSSLWVSAFYPPEWEHHGEGNDRQEHDRVAAHKPECFGEWAG